MQTLTVESTLPLPKTSLSIPRLGFGLYESESCLDASLYALKAGYRQLDSAQYYGNESEVGKAVLQCGIPRSELFLTTKIADVTHLGPKETYQSIVKSVERMNGGVEGGYVDMFLIHDASEGKDEVRKLWMQLDRAHKEGLCRAIGISNAGKGHIEAMREYATVRPPHVNQIEVSPLLPRCSCC